MAEKSTGPLGTASASRQPSQDKHVVQPPPDNAITLIHQSRKGIYCASIETETKDQALYS